MSRALWPIYLLMSLAACSSSDPQRGTERGPCHPNGTCNEGLECSSDICVRRSIAADAGTPDGGSTNDAGDVDSGTPADAGGSCTSLLPNGALGYPVADACAAEWCCPEMDRCAADQGCASCAARGGL